MKFQNIYQYLEFNYTKSIVYQISLPSINYQKTT